MDVAKLKPGSNAVEFTDKQEAEAREVGVVIIDGDVDQNNAPIADKRVGGESER